MNLRREERGVECGCHSWLAQLFTKGRYSEAEHLSSETSGNVGGDIGGHLFKSCSKDLWRNIVFSREGQCWEGSDGPDLLQGACFPPCQTRVYMEKKLTPLPTTNRYPPTVGLGHYDHQKHTSYSHLPPGGARLLLVENHEPWVWALLEAM